MKFNPPSIAGIGTILTGLIAAVSGSGIFTLDAQANSILLAIIGVLTGLAHINGSQS